MSESKKTALNFLLAAATLLLTAFFWTTPLMLSVFLFVVAVVMLIVEKRRSAIFVYIVIFMLGPLSEALVMRFGAWSYAEPHLLGFPIWLPFIWGNAGLFINRLSFYIRSLAE